MFSGRMRGCDWMLHEPLRQFASAQDRAVLRKRFDALAELATAGNESNLKKTVEGDCNLPALIGLLRCVTNHVVLDMRGRPADPELRAEFAKLGVLMSVFTDVASENRVKEMTQHGSESEKARLAHFEDFVARLEKDEKTKQEIALLTDGQLEQRRYDVLTYLDHAVKDYRDGIVKEGSPEAEAIKRRVQVALRAGNLFDAEVANRQKNRKAAANEKDGLLPEVRAALQRRAKVDAEEAAKKKEFDTAAAEFDKLVKGIILEDVFDRSGRKDFVTKVTEAEQAMANLFFQEYEVGREGFKAFTATHAGAISNVHGMPNPAIQKKLQMEIFTPARKRLRAFDGAKSEDSPVATAVNCRVQVYLFRAMACIARDFVDGLKAGMLFPEGPIEAHAAQLEYSALVFNRLETILIDAAANAVIAKSSYQAFVSRREVVEGVKVLAHFKATWPKKRESAIRGVKDEIEANKKSLASATTMPKAQQIMSTLICKELKRTGMTEADAKAAAKKAVSVSVEDGKGDGDGDAQVAPAPASSSPASGSVNSSSSSSSSSSPGPSPSSAPSTQMLAKK